MLAPSRISLSWGWAVDVQWVRGDLAALASYGVSGTGALAAATALDIAADDPPLGAGFYYLVRFGGACGSWQTAPAAEPARDAALP